MNTLEELKYYCDEKNPVGALMLTGEWGCGKTYLLEHELSKAVADTHILVRISLFGIDSIDALNLAVKKQWTKKCTAFLGKLQDEEKKVEASKSIFGTIVSLVPVLKDIKDSILTINPLDYVTIKPEVDVEGNKKKVVLIFDDLERCKLDTIDVLGCINEYCENQGFNTIIVANEEKMPEKKSKKQENGKQDFDEVSKPGISYEEIKEKIVARTIHYDPDYESIVVSILDNQVWSDADYTAFLRENKRLIQNVFTKEIAADYLKKESMQRPYNIRSLKCALQDFYRIYPELKCAAIEHLDRCLYAFIAYTMAVKAGIAEEDDYGFMLTNGKVKNYYPLYDGNYMFPTAQRWLHRGEWDQESFHNELDKLAEQQKPKELKEKLRSSRFIDCEEEEIIEGYEGLLEDAYSGKLQLVEYVQLIENSRYIREYEITVPTQIDWDKVADGIEMRFQADIKNVENKYFCRDISEKDRSMFSDDELKAYDLIKDFREGNKLMFARSRQMYLEEIAKGGIGAFTLCQNKRFDSFDGEMAKVTVESYIRSSQYDKGFFPGCFADTWRFCDTNPDFKREETRDGFKELAELLKVEKTKYSESGKNIAAKHTEAFIKTVEELIVKLDAAIENVKNAPVEG